MKSVSNFGELIKEKTGLETDSYFSASKINWILENIPNARSQAENGELAFGTVDSWLVWKLTNGKKHSDRHFKCFADFVIQYQYARMG